MSDVFGVDIPTPDINLTGFFSSSWIWIAIVIVIGAILVTIIGLLLFFKTFKDKAVIFKHGFKSGIEKKIRMRRIVRDKAGLFVFKLMFCEEYAPSDSKPMFERNYWFERGPDGYLRNFVLNDKGEIEYIHTDVRLFAAAIDKQSVNNYGQGDKLMKIVTYVAIFLLLCVFFGGMWLIIGKVGDSTQALSATAETNRQVLETLNNILNNQQFFNNGGTASGLVTAS